MPNKTQNNTMENTKQSHPPRNSIPLIARFRFYSGWRYHCVGGCIAFSFTTYCDSITKLFYITSILSILFRIYIWCLCHLTLSKSIYSARISERMRWIGKKQSEAVVCRFVVDCVCIGSTAPCDIFYSICSNHPYKKINKTKDGLNKSGFQREPTNKHNCCIVHFI